MPSTASHQCSASCTAGWQASRKCHCHSCGENFSTVANFDKHRRDGACLWPGRAGLALNIKTNMWMLPGEEDIRARLNRAPAEA